MSIAVANPLPEPVSAGIGVAVAEPESVSHACHGIVDG
jgi:hypothetical protein